MTKPAAAIALLTAVPALLIFTASAHAQVEVSAAVQHDVAPPLGSMASASPGAESHREKPLRLIPHNLLVNNGSDGAVQNTTGPLVGTTNGLSFAGVGKGDYGFSPD